LAIDNSQLTINN